ncbi:hypothetical protein ACVU7I_03470, partial [Patulibacter sp. S7RM1-6]
GADGARGATGPLAVYRCQDAKRGGRYKVACFVEVRRGEGSTRPRTVSVRVRRSTGALYATGGRKLYQGQRRVPVTGRRSARPGRYQVVATIRTRGRTETLRGSFVVRG